MGIWALFTQDHWSLSYERSLPPAEYDLLGKATTAALGVYPKGGSLKDFIEIRPDDGFLRFIFAPMILLRCNNLMALLMATIWGRGLHGLICVDPVIYPMDNDTDDFTKPSIRGEIEMATIRLHQLRDSLAIAATDQNVESIRTPHKSRCVLETPILPKRCRLPAMLRRSYHLLRRNDCVSPTNTARQVA